MKYLKKYEASTSKTFSEWLKNPKRPNKLEFDFEFPIKKHFEICENWEEYNLFDFLSQQRGVNLYKSIQKDMKCLGCDGSGEMGNENPDLTDKWIETGKPTCELCDGTGQLTIEEIRSNFDDVFDEWINQEYNDDLENFYNSYELIFDDTDINQKDFEDLKKDFDDSNLSQYLSPNAYNINFQIFNMKINTIDTNIVKGSFESNKELSENDIDVIKDYLIGQLSDGWGEMYEQKIRKEKICGLKFNVNVVFNWEGYPQRYLTIK